MPNLKKLPRTLLLAIAILSAVLPVFTRPASAAAYPCDLSNPSSPLSGCKAVIVVTPIDGDTGSETLKQVGYAEQLANLLVSRGATVTRMYHPYIASFNFNWQQVYTAASGAHIFVYRGHGIAWGSGVYGGINLKTQMITNDMIRADLKLTPNAIVMLFACWATGTGNDDVFYKISISAAEARNRVNQYAEPYMTNGASVVFADWSGNAFPDFFDNNRSPEYSLISGMTLGEVYKDPYYFNPAGFTAYSYPRNPEDVTWVDYHYYGGINQYNHSFVGNPNLKMRDLFVPRLRLVGSTTINLKVNTFHPAASPAQSFTVYVTNTQMVLFNWSAVKTYNRSWVLMPRTAGTNVKYDPLTFTITTYGLPPGTYTEQIVVSSSTPDILDSPQTITMTIEAFRYQNFVFLPALSR